MPVFVRTQGIGSRAPRPATVRRRAERMLIALRLSDAELSVLLCDDRTILNLNRTWRRRAKATDVLAFPMEEAGAGRILGDIVISLETAARQATRAGRSPREEVTELLAHGLLHLLGFDHPSRGAERRMRAQTDALRAAARRTTPGRRSSAR